MQGLDLYVDDDDILDKKSVRCTKGMQLKEWFEKNTKVLKKLKVPQVDELSSDEITKMVMKKIIDNGLMHAVRKKKNDKRKLVFPVKSQEWNESTFYLLYLSTPKPLLTFPDYWGFKIDFVRSAWRKSWEEDREGERYVVKGRTNG